MHTKVSVQGAIVEVTEMEHRNRHCHAWKVDADHWVDNDGELHEYKKRGERRTDNAQELRATFKRIRALVNTNCVRPEGIRWITLTYRENMTDTKRLYRDFDSFWRKYKRRWGRAEYIVVVEPQARGAWHVHLLAIHDGRAPFVPNEELAECWGQGFVKVKAVKDCDNLGAYLSAYLSDAEVGSGEACTTEKKCSDGTTKRILKGGRLHMYPKGMQIYRHSRGIRKPEEYWHETVEDVERTEELTEGAAMTYRKEYVWRDDRTGEERRVVKTWYNRLRVAGPDRRRSDDVHAHGTGGPPMRAGTQAEALRARPHGGLFGTCAPLRVSTVG